MSTINIISKNSKKFIIVIIGATGTGKTKLAVELAKQFNGEIINADSMQIYSGLNIITNQPSPQELNSCKHHLLEFRSPLEEPYSVHEFQKTAIPIINDLQDRGQLPIVVGGTNYYIESLLWKFILNPTADKKGTSEDIPTDIQNVQQIIQPKCVKNATADYQKLWQEDNAMAKRIHPSDSRKIQRALSIIDEKGKKMSDILDSQEIGTKTGPLRYDNPLIIWLQCNKENLETRLNNRIDTMLEKGLLKELKDFHTKYNADRIKKMIKLDYSQGVFQTIGFKEFHDYLIDSENNKELLDQGIEKMKIATRQYSRRQIRWITNRFIKRSDNICPSVYGLDATDISKWDSEVRNKSFNITEQYLNNKEIDIPPIKQDERSNDKEFNICEVCDRIFLTEIDWQSHIKSRRHRKMKTRKRVHETLTTNLDNYIKKKKNE